MATATFDWADGRYAFRLGLGELRELQERTKAGPQALIRRIASGEWMVDDLRETIRIGLVGGGAKPVDAVRLVRRYVDEQPLIESVAPALTILQAVLTGFDEAAPGKKTPKPRKRTASTSAPSTDPAP